MKYCLKLRQDSQYLAKADEIKAEYRDHKAFPDIVEKYPDKTLICQIYANQEDIDWESLKLTNKMALGRFICCVGSYDQMKQCKEFGIKFYYGFPITTFQDLRTLKEIGVCYVRLGAPLFFSLDDVKAIGVPVRAVPNLAYLSDLPYGDGVCGTWIRPEDMEAYEPYVEAVEFEGCNTEQERALYRIYAEQHEWPGFLDTLLTNFNKSKVSNSLIHPDFTKFRLNCGQRCMRNGSCSLCHRWMSLANREKLEKYQAALVEN